MPTSYLASDLANLDDEQLDKFLEENGRTIVVKDIFNLPQSLLQRLRDRMNPERYGASSRPVDMDQVAAKLAAGLTRSQRRSATPESESCFEPEELVEKRIEWEQSAHEKLVRDGGRPMYPIDKLRAVAEDPEGHKDLFLPLYDIWPRSDGTKEVTWFLVFGEQLDLWNDFREEQRKCRESEERFSSFCTNAPKLLEMVGFTRPVAFDMDASRQDKLTTWIESVVSICYKFYRKPRRFLPRYQKEKDQPWATYLNWTLDQIPLVEEEMAQEEKAKAGLAAAPGASEAPSSPATRKRLREEDNLAAAQQPGQGREGSTKRARTSLGPDVPAASETAAETTKAATKRPSAAKNTAASTSTRPRRSLRRPTPQPTPAVAASAAGAAAADPAVASKPLRRSSRIADLQEKKLLAERAAAAAAKPKPSLPTAKPRKAPKTAKAAKQKSAPAAQPAARKKRSPTKAAAPRTRKDATKARRK